MKAVVATFNQEKALVGSFSVIVKLYRWIGLRHVAVLVQYNQTLSTTQFPLPGSKVDQIVMLLNNVINVILSEGNNLTLTAADGVES